MSFYCNACHSWFLSRQSRQGELPQLNPAQSDYHSTLWSDDDVISRWDSPTVTTPQKLSPAPTHTWVFEIFRKQPSLKKKGLALIVFSRPSLIIPLCFAGYHHTTSSGLYFSHMVAFKRKEESIRRQFLPDESWEPTIVLPSPKTYPPGSSTTSRTS